MASVTPRSHHKNLCSQGWEIALVEKMDCRKTCEVTGRDGDVLNEIYQRRRARFLASPPETDVGSVTIIADSYKVNEAKPKPLKRTVGIHDLLSRMGICIREDELKVCNHGRRSRMCFSCYAISSASASVVFWTANAVSFLSLTVLKFVPGTRS